MIRSFNQRRKFKRLFRKKRDLKLGGLMSEKFSQKLRELSANEKIHNDISIQELIAILEESKNEMNDIASLLWQEQLEKEAELILRDVASETEAREWLKTLD